MPEEPSIIERSERVFDDVSRLWHRRPWLCIGILIALLSPSLVLLADKFWGRSKLQEEISGFKSQLAETKRDRDSKATQLAPFLAVANEHFASAPPDRRLDLLLDRTETLGQLLRQVISRLPRSTWALSLEAQSRITEKLNSAPRVQLIITTTHNAEAFALGEQIKTTFKLAGFDPGQVEPIITGEVPEGLLILCRRPPDGPLRDALIQLFDELGVPPNIKGLEPPGIAPDSPIEMEIAVGTK